MTPSPATVCSPSPELAPTDRRGIDVVRNKIKMFAQKKVTLPPGRHKVVILDEADRCALGSASTGWGRKQGRSPPPIGQGGERTPPRPPFIYSQAWALLLNT